MLACSIKAGVQTVHCLSCEILEDSGRAVYLVMENSRHHSRKRFGREKEIAIRLIAEKYLSATPERPSRRCCTNLACYEQAEN